jgi:hypothetical protein
MLPQRWSQIEYAERNTENGTFLSHADSPGASPFSCSRSYPATPQITHTPSEPRKPRRIPEPLAGPNVSSSITASRNASVIGGKNPSEGEAAQVWTWHGRPRLPEHPAFGGADRSPVGCPRHGSPQRGLSVLQSPRLCPAAAGLKKGKIETQSPPLGGERRFSSSSGEGEVTTGCAERKLRHFRGSLSAPPRLGVLARKRAG